MKYKKIKKGLATLLANTSLLLPVAQTSADPITWFQDKGLEGVVEQVTLYADREPTYDGYSSNAGPSYKQTQGLTFLLKTDAGLQNVTIDDKYMMNIPAGEIITYLQYAKENEKEVFVKCIYTEGDGEHLLGRYKSIIEIEDTAEIEVALTRFSGYKNKGLFGGKLGDLWASEKNAFWKEYGGYHYNSHGIYASKIIKKDGNQGDKTTGEKENE